jgi:hypothetical protein
MRVLEGLFAAMIRKTIIALAGLALMTSAAWAQNRKEIYELQERCGRRAEQIYEKDFPSVSGRVWNPLKITTASG